MKMHQIFSFFGGQMVYLRPSLITLGISHYLLAFDMPDACDTKNGSVLILGM
jgi:hypothetical protein